MSKNFLPFWELIKGFDFSCTWGLTVLGFPFHWPRPLRVSLKTVVNFNTDCLPYMDLNIFNNFAMSTFSSLSVKEVCMVKICQSCIYLSTYLSPIYCSLMYLSIFLSTGEMTAITWSPCEEYTCTGCQGRIFSRPLVAAIRTKEALN